MEHKHVKLWLFSCCCLMFCPHKCTSFIIYGQVVCPNILRSQLQQIRCWWIRNSRSRKQHSTCLPLPRNQNILRVELFQAMLVLNEHKHENHRPHVIHTKASITTSTPMQPNPENESYNMMPKATQVPHVKV